MASQPHQPQIDRLVIGIAGRIGSGKTTVGKYLEGKFGYQYLRYSAVLADWNGLNPENKADLQKIGWVVMIDGLQSELNRRLIAEILPDRSVAVDGLRHLLDFEMLRETFNDSFRLLFVETPPRLRFERLQARGKYQTYASFSSADGHPVERQIDLLREKSSCEISNVDSIEHLCTEVDQCISRFQKEGQA
jgi:dephospho-CoA kinase